jgi:hypothetical protein
MTKAAAPSSAEASPSTARKRAAGPPYLSACLRSQRHTFSLHPSVLHTNDRVRVEDCVQRARRCCCDLFAAAAAACRQASRARSTQWTTRKHHSSLVERSGDGFLPATARVLPGPDAGRAAGSCGCANSSGPVFGEAGAYTQVQGAIGVGQLAVKGERQTPPPGCDLGLLDDPARQSQRCTAQKIQHTTTSRMRRVCSTEPAPLGRRQHRQQARAAAAAAHAAACENRRPSPNVHSLPPGPQRRGQARRPVGPRQHPQLRGDPAGPRARPEAGAAAVAGAEAGRGLLRRAADGGAGGGRSRCAACTACVRL